MRIKLSIVVELQAVRQISSRSKTFQAHLFVRQVGDPTGKWYSTRCGKIVGPCEVLPWLQLEPKSRCGICEAKSHGNVSHSVHQPLSR